MQPGHEAIPTPGTCAPAGLNAMVHMRKRQDGVGLAGIYRSIYHGKIIHNRPLSLKASHKLKCSRTHKIKSWYYSFEAPNQSLSKGTCARLRLPPYTQKTDLNKKLF
eukprot:1016721-Amphidinium_carterae.1